MPKTFNLTDKGNAERMLMQAQGDIRYCHSLKTWYIWNDRYWQPDNTGRIWGIALTTVEEIPKEVGAIGISTDPAIEAILAAQRGKILSHAHASEAKMRLQAMIDIAQSMAPISTDEMDNDKWLFNCQNGTLDIRTGELGKHDRDHFITRCAPVDYRSNSNSVLWQVFLDQVLPDPDIQRFVQKAVGYSMTGDCGEEVMFFLYGSGANGKSTFMNAVLEVMGEYSSQVSPNTLALQPGERPRNDLAKLMGKRFVSASEASGKDQFDEELLKRMTGQDKVVARFLYKEEFELYPTWKIWLMSNHRPRIEGTDTAIWRRLRLIPFSATIPIGQQDPAIKNDLTHVPKHRSGVLKWALDGARMWQKEGLKPPQGVLDATHKYRVEMDILGQFLADCCGVRLDVRCRCNQLYNLYKDYCQKNGEDYKSILSHKAFTQQLVSRGDGNIETRKMHGVRYYVGIRIQVEVDLSDFIDKNGG